MYTKQQRHEIYKKAVERAYERIEMGYQIGVCDSIRVAANLPPGRYTYMGMPKKFPEFGLFRPPYLTGEDMWWDASDKNSRINCLLFCIEMSK